MSGALAERDFVEKLERAGFTDVRVVERLPYGVEDAEMYPLFTADLIALMYELIPPEKQDSIGMSIVMKARLAP